MFSHLRSYQLGIFAALMWAPFLLGQSNSDRRPDKVGDEETEEYYKKWLKQDVLYIITDEERAVFRKLPTPEEKDAFIEQFWFRRDSDPRTSINEFKEEYYQRIAYANERFTSGVHGWATDRGRIYIMYGPPNTIDDHMGGTYRRRPEEGGGYTSAYAFQRWFYNHIPGVGSGIEIEFVDASKTGEYRIALRPSEKDALWQTGRGLTTAEMLGAGTRAGAMTSDLAMRNLGFAGDASYMRGARPFDRIRQYFDLSKPPEIKFEDLRAEVDTRVLYGLIPMKVTSGAYRVGETAFLAPLTLQIPAHELTYMPGAVEEVERAVVSIYGKVENLLGRIVYEFEDLLAADGLRDQTLNEQKNFLYQKQLPLHPGKYKVTIIAKDQSSERMASAVTGIHLPEPERGNLTTSPLILADGLTSSSPQETVSDPFVTPSGLKVYPSVAGEFRAGTTLGFYTEVYEVAIDQATLQPSVDAKLTLLREGESLRSEEPKLLLLADRVALLHTIDLTGLPPASYQLMLQLHDRISGQRLVKRVSFKIVS